MELKEWLGKDNQIGIDIWTKKYQHSNETFEEWLDRVSGGDKELRQLIKEKKFLFGGRVLANRGVENAGNYYNCFSAGYVSDDYEEILNKFKKIIQLLANDEVLPEKYCNHLLEPKSNRNMGMSC